MANFRALLERNPFIETVELSNYGEIFLNPHLIDIFEFAFRRGVTLTADNGVNLNFVRPEVLEGLVKYQVRGLTCSIDGASPEVYARYRVRGNFNAVIDNIRKLNAIKLEYKSPYPRLSWQFVAFVHNQHEIPIARQMARELDMDFQVKLSWDDSLSPVSDLEQLRAEADGAATRDEHRARHGHDYMQTICHQLWARPQVNWDGKLLGCCRNFWGDFGANVFEQGLTSAVNNEKMRYARKMLTGRAPARQGIPCTTCDLYLQMRQSDQWLTANPVGRKVTVRRVAGAIQRRLKWFAHGGVRSSAA